MLCSLLYDWNYFWNKHFNLPFLAICHSRSSHQRYFIKKFLKNFTKFTGKHLCLPLNKVAGLSIFEFREFFLRTPFLRNTSGRLLLPFPIFPLIFPASFWYKKVKMRCEWACEIKKIYCDQTDLLRKNWLIITLKGFIKQPVIKQSPTFLTFSFLIDYCMSVFSLIKAFEKISSASLHFT